MLSTDQNILEKNSAVAARMLEYGSLVDELHIIVFSIGGFVGRKRLQIANNIWVYPTNSKNKLFYGWDAIKIGKTIIKSRKDEWLVTSQDPFETGLAASLLAYISMARLQLQVHTDFLSKHFITSILNHIRTILALFLLPKADGIRVVSKRIKESLQSKHIKFKAEIDVLPIHVKINNIINTKPEFNVRERYPQFKFNILMVGRLEAEKNYKLALEAFKSVVQKHPKTGLIIVGDGSEKKTIEKLIEKYNLQENVILAGSRKDVISYYKTADLFLHTSNYEGYGLALVEAAASGCPIVTTSVGVIGDTLNKDNTSVCEVGDTGCIRKSIIIAMENKSLRARMSQDAQKSILATATTKEEYLKQYKQSWEKCMLE
ncbi:glycosyltransferase [Patescibacteria group bacterium]